MRTLLAHEWLSAHGGSENVFEQIWETFPSARRVSLWNDAPERFGNDVEETWLARTPLRRSKAAALALMPAAWASVPLDDVDQLVVSSHAMGHLLAGRAARLGMPALCYTHTPARYLWTPDLDPRGSSPVARLVANVLRQHDRRGTHGSVRYVANSRYIARRIKQAWGREAEVLYPPVDVRKWQRLSAVAGGSVDLPTGGFVLGASRFVEYKRLDLAIRLGELVDLPVVLAGTGPQEPQLRALASRARVPVTIIDAPTDQELAALYEQATVFAFLGVEDFGIMPVESMALGTPVVVAGEGGARESVELLNGGAVAMTYSDAELRRAGLEAMGRDMGPAREAVLELSNESFRKNFAALVGGAS